MVTGCQLTSQICLECVCSVKCVGGKKYSLGATRVLNRLLPLTGLRVSGLHGAQIRDTERSMCEQSSMLFA